MEKEIIKVLIVDDDPEIHTLIRHLLGKLDDYIFAIFDLHDEITTVQFLTAGQFDLVFLDILMGPNRSTKNVIELLSSSNFEQSQINADIGVTIMSAHMTDDLSASLQEKSNNIIDTITKPITKDTLIKTIDAYHKFRGGIKKDSTNMSTNTKETEVKVNGESWTFKNNPTVEEITPLSWIKNDINFRNSDGETCLMTYSQKGELKIIEQLLEGGADINLKSKKGWTALHYAASSDQINTIELLIENDANTNTPSTTHTTPLHIAITSGSFATCKLLVSNGTRLHTKLEGDSYLMMALKHNQLEIFDFLLSVGLSPADKDINGNSIIQLAKSKKKIHFLHLIKADLEKRNKKR